MDPNSTPQTVAQAVQAATQQAQQQIASHSPQLQSPSTTQPSAIDNLTCQWQGCGERCDSAELLYDHVCERHVGRKSTNNLNLTCQWGACRTTTVKRDHITSHIRVHVPLKPHICHSCKKAFKRPQDLKKHVKTHADDSPLISSPAHGANSRLNGGLNLGQPNGKPSGYYPASHDLSSLVNPYTSYQPAMATTAGNSASYGHAGANSHYTGYGSVSYPNSSAMADVQSLDTRRRAIEALNDFLGDIKRRAIDPGNYYDVGQRLQTNALPLPVGTGYNTGYSNSTYNSNYNTASLLESFNNGGTLHHSLGSQPALSSHGYALPLPNARTKNDLQDIDRFLEQLQTTVYEQNTNSAAASGQHSIENMTIPGLFGGGTHTTQSYRSSHSPPHAFSDHMTNGSTPGSSINDTPVNTPSTVPSYNPSLSPMSNHSRASYGSNSNMYPSLPAVTGISDLGSNYPTTTSAPAPILAQDFNHHYEPRQTSRLQREAPPSADAHMDTEMVDVDDDSGSRTPRQEDAHPKGKGENSIDPALRDADQKSPEPPSTPTASSETESDKRQEQWIENIRVIEALRKWIGDRLKTGEFEGASTSDDASSLLKEGTSEIDLKTVETAKMVAEKLADAEIDAKDVESLVQYPKLPASVE